MAIRSKAGSRLHIDWTRCDGRGMCTELLPELLSRDDWGYPVVGDGMRDAVIPRADHGYARAAVSRCPRLALSLIADEADGKSRHPGG